MLIRKGLSGLCEFYVSGYEERKECPTEEGLPKTERVLRKTRGQLSGHRPTLGRERRSAESQRTLQICLSEIERCQNLSPKPNFIILLGDRYGYGNLCPPFLRQSSILFFL